MKIFLIGILIFGSLVLLSAYIEKDNNHPYWQNIKKSLNIS